MNFGGRPPSNPQGQYGGYQFPGGMMPQGGQPMMQQNMMMAGNPMMQQQQRMMGMQMGMMTGGMQQPAPQGFGMTQYQPPPYTQQMAQNYQARTSDPKPPQKKGPQKTPEELMKERHFQEQQQKLKQFGKLGSGKKMDAHSMIDNMFGAMPAKPKPQPAAVAPQSSNTASASDDGFGDFLGGPSVPAASGEDNGFSGFMSGPAVAQVQPTEMPQQSVIQDTAQAGVSEAQVEPEKPKQQKKGLEDMMMACSDLTAPQKARTFHKPTVKEIQPKHVKGPSYQQSNKATTWAATNTDQLSEMFTLSEPLPDRPPPPRQYGPSQSRGAETQKQQIPNRPFKVPKWVTDDSMIPEVYKHVLEAVTSENAIDTNKVYPILVLSGLPRPVLGQIWEMANKATPGQLNKQELYMILALIALAQNNYSASSLHILERCPKAPVPFLGQSMGATPQAGSSGVPPQQAGGSEASPRDMPSIPTEGVPPGQVPPTGVLGSVPAQPGDISHGSAVPAAPGNFPVLSAPSNVQMPTVSSMPVMANIPQQSMPSALSMPAMSSIPGTGSQVPGFSEAVSGSRNDDFEDFQSAPSNPTSNAQPTESSHGFASFQQSGTTMPQSTPSVGFAAFPPSVNPSVTTASSIGSTPAVSSSPAVSSVVTADDDFEDFQEAPRPASGSFASFTSSSSMPGPSTASTGDLMDAGDKYGALRAFTADSGLFNETKPDEPVSDNWAGFQSGGTASGEQDKTDDWAGFQTGSVAMDTQNTGGDWSGFQSKDSTGGEGGTTSWNAFGDENPEDDRISALFPKVKISKNSNGLASFENTDDAKGNDEFADFQSVGASSESISNFSMAPPVSANSSDNKYDIFKQLGSDSNNQSLLSMTPPADSQTGQSDDWANFQEAPQTSPQTVQDAGKTMIAIKGLASSKAKDDKHLQKDLEIKKQKDNEMDDFGEFQGEKETPLPAENNKQSRGATKFTYGGFMSGFKPKPAQPPAISLFDTEPPPLTDDDFGHSPNEDIDHTKAALDIDEHFDSDFMGWSRQGQNIKIEDSQSVSSLELPTIRSLSKIKEDNQSESSLEFVGVKDYSKGSSPDGGSGQDDLSNSSNEVDFGAFESGQKSTSNTPDQQSVGSLDIKPTGLNEAVPSSPGPNSNDVEFGDLSKVTDTQKNQNEAEWCQTPRSATDILAASVGNAAPVIGDKYSAIMEVVQAENRHATEWLKCLKSCESMICEANNTLNSITSSSVCNEVVSSEQGKEYLSGIIEIYRVVCRVTASMKAIGVTSPDLTNTMKTIDLAWNNMCAFIGPLMPEQSSLDFSSYVIESEEDGSEQKACGVCILNVDVNQTEGQKLTYGGRQYHTPCANFWINCVDSLLPALTLPHLL